MPQPTGHDWTHTISRRNSNATLRVASLGSSPVSWLDERLQKRVEPSELVTAYGLLVHDAVRREVEEAGEAVVACVCVV